MDGGLAFIAAIVIHADIDKGVALDAGILIAHRGHLATAVDVAIDGASSDVDGGVVVDTSGKDVGRPAQVGISSVCGGVVGGSHAILTAVAAAVDGAEIIAATADSAHGSTDGATLDVDGGTLGHGPHLAATINVTLDGAAGDGHRGLLDASQRGPQGVDSGLVHVEDTAHSTSEDVAALGVYQFLVGIELGEAQGAGGLVDKGVGWIIDILVVVADDAAGDVNGDVAVVGTLPHLTIVLCLGGRHKPGAHGGQTATAVNGAQHGTAFDIDGDVATHDTCRESFAAESTAAAEDIAIDIGGAKGADFGVGATDSHRGVAEDVTVLAATEDGAVNPASGDIDRGAGDLSPGVEEDALVALATTEEVAGDRVVVNLVKGAGHAKGSAAHVDSTIALDVGKLVATIGAGEDMAACDVELRVAVDDTCRLQPFTRNIGEVSRTATEDVAVEGMAVLTSSGGIVGIIARLVGKGVVGGIGRGVIPMVTLGEGGVL